VVNLPDAPAAQATPSPVATPLDAAAAASNPLAATPGSLNTLGDIAGPQGIQTIEAALPAYLARQRWFGAKSRTIASARIAWTTPVPQSSGILAGIEVEFEDSGENEVYLLPLATASGEEAAAIRSDAIKSILTALEAGGETKIVYDATANEGFRHALKEMICAAHEVAATGDLAQPGGQASPYSLVAAHSAALKGLDLDIDSRVGSAEQSNTSILFADRAILKLFRRLRAGENPDVEITRFLTDVAHFPHIAAYFGDLHLASDATTIAFLQAFAKNEGDGWQWMQNALVNFLDSVKAQPAPGQLQHADPLAKFTPPAALASAAADSLAAAATLGHITAELHLALATPSANPAFTPEPYDDAALNRDRTRMATQITHALDALSSRSANVGGDEAELTQRLLAQRGQLLTQIEGLGRSEPTLAASFGQRIRVHGARNSHRSRTSLACCAASAMPPTPLRPSQERASHTRRPRTRPPGLRCGSPPRAQPSSTRTARFCPILHFSPRSLIRMNFFVRYCSKRRLMSCCTNSTIGPRGWRSRYAACSL